MEYMEEDTYASEDDWSNNDVSYQEYNDEDDEYVHENQQWHDEESFSTNIEDGLEEEGLEPKPPDPDQYPYSDLNEYLPDSSYEDSTYEDYYGEHNEERSYGCSYQKNVKIFSTHKNKSHNYGISSQQATYHSTQAMSKKRIKKGSDYASNPFVFTGSSKDPEVYLQWETEMKQWFRSHNIPKEEKLSYALSMLDGEAYKWWLKEDAATYYTSKAVLDWGTLKARMYREFTRKYRTTTRSVKSTPNLQPFYEHKSTHHVQPKHKFIDTLTRMTKEEQSIQEEKIQQKLIITSLVEQQEPLKGKSSNSTIPLELMCYKCKQQGHIAKDCPTKKKTKADEFLIHTCQKGPKHPNLETLKKDEVGREVKSNPTVPKLGEELMKQYEPKTMKAPQESSNLIPQVSVQTKAIEELHCLSNSCEPNSVITHLSCQEILNVVSAKRDEDTNDSFQPKEKLPDEPTKMNKLDGSSQGNLEEHDKVSNKLVELELSLC